MGRHFDRRGKQRQKSAGRRADTSAEGATFEVVILRWAHGGEGVALPESGPYAGRVTFVANVVPGDVVELVAREVKARWVRAALVRVVRPSEARREARCTHQAVCGGCPWMPGTVAVQAESRAHILAGELRKRLGPGAPAPVMRETPVEFGYRQRLRMKAVGGVLGFTARASHDLVPVVRCEVADERINEAVAGAGSWLPEMFSGRVTLLAGEDGVAIALEPEGGGLVKAGPEATRVRFGDAFVQRLRPEAFAQANAAVVGQVLRDIEMLAEAPARRAREAGRRPFAVELFAGSGTLTTALWSAGYDVEAYEVAPEAKAGFEETRAEWARSNANSSSPLGKIVSGMSELSPRDPEEIVSGTSKLSPDDSEKIVSGTSTLSPDDSEKIVSGTSDARPGILGEIVSGTWHACDLLGAGIVTPAPTRAPDLVLVDPPRTGAWPIVPWLRVCAAERILYLACDLAAGLRDVAELCKENAGWRLEQAIAYDMFTHSGHQEVLFVLGRDLTAEA